MLCAASFGMGAKMVELKEGDLIRVRSSYMLVVRGTESGIINHWGGYLYAVDVIDIAKQLSLQKASRVGVSTLTDFEIIERQT